MKTAIITFTVLVAFATPSLATDHLRLLATVSQVQADDATQDLRAIISKQEAKSSKLEAQLNSNGVNPLTISRDRSLGNN